MEALKKKWEDLNLSRDEVRDIGEALQKEEFRNLLLDYVKEINDPENRKQYEQEITQLEQERGVDVKFIHPTSGYVIKTSVDGRSKAFINICSNIHIGKPTSSKDISNGNAGLRWSIPHSLAPPREDLDKKRNACIVYDVVFHPETLCMSSSNDAFKRIVEETAISAVEDNFNVSLDKVNIKYPKMQFKGSKHPTVIRSKMKDFTPSSDLMDLPDYPYSPVIDTKPTETTEVLTNKHAKEKLTSCNDKIYTKPKYTIKYRNTLDMQNFTNDPLTKRHITVPNELIIVIDLPLLKCSTDASIDVTENSVVLKSDSPAKYYLHLKLPYHVDRNRGNAKFDSSKKVLTITLSVLKPENIPAEELAREDSGVESDNYNGRSNSVSSNDDELVEKETSTNKVQNNLFSNDINKHLNNNHSFLKDNVHYVFPDFSGHIMGQTLTFTIQVPHVNPKSVEYCFLNDNKGFHLTFISMGSGFFPLNYSFYVLLPCSNQLEHETFNVEVWDNNIITQVKLVAGQEYSTEYCIGIYENKCNKVEISYCPSAVESLEEEEDTSPSSIINAGNNENTETDKLWDEEKYPTVSESPSSFDESNSSPPRLSPKSRTVSESCQEDNMRTKRRGILKIGRSLSESSVDDYVPWSTEKMEKAKKTVRFSEVISRQTFRLNSSILGQRKKNQRKTRNKKRAQERRLSESGGESEAENEFSSKGNNICDKDHTYLLTETESSSCDVSDVSEISDISESDDGQKGEVKSFLPCSNKKNHKRRGKKSARKNAATAKLQFMEN